MFRIRTIAIAPIKCDPARPIPVPRLSKQLDATISPTQTEMALGRPSFLLFISITSFFSIRKGSVTFT